MSRRPTTYRHLGWLLSLLLVSCTTPDFDNPWVEDKDQDGVLAAYECDDNDPLWTGLCDPGQRCKVDSQCHHGLCVSGRCACAPGWYGPTCDRTVADREPTPTENWRMAGSPCPSPAERGRLNAPAEGG